MISVTELKVDSRMHVYLKHTYTHYLHTQTHLHFKFTDFLLRQQQKRDHSGAKTDFERTLFPRVLFYINLECKFKFQGVIFLKAVFQK